MTATAMHPIDGLDPNWGGSPPRRHSTYVQIIAAGGFFASCNSCGSDPFPNRQRLEQAEQDARAHGDLHHLYPRERLEAHDRATLAREN